jgi:hypothetical protein
MAWDLAHLDQVGAADRRRADRLEKRRRPLVAAGPFLHRDGVDPGGDLSVLREHLLHVLRSAAWLSARL